MSTVTLAHRRAAFAQGKFFKFGVKWSRLFASGSRCAGLGVGSRAASFSGGQRSEDRSQKSEALASAGGTSVAPAAAGSIRVWIVGATGFRQDYSKVTGLELLWRKMRSLSAPDVCVTTPQRWDEDPEELAAYIARNSQRDATVFFYGYSYGVGNFFVKFARALQGHGIAVDTAVLCDGVKRFRFLKFLSFRHFNAAFTIEVPTNVETVYAFFQVDDELLWGHRVVAEDAEATEVLMIEQHGYKHDAVDEAESFHRVALKEAEDAILRA